MQPTPSSRFHRLRGLLAAVGLLAILLGLAPTVAATAQTPVVRAVMFFSPTCGHCELVINEVLPPLAEQYGDQLQIELINVMFEPGALVYQNAVQELNIPQDRLGVPTLIIGETVLVGSGEIPEQLPGLIERGLASGGIALPQITGLADLAAAAAPPPVTILTETPPVVAPAAVDATAAPAAVVPATPPPAAEVAPLAAPGWREMLRRDPAGNTLALVVLVVMLLSVIVVTLGYITDAAYLRTAWPAKLAKFIPTFAVIGLGVALYLSYVEVLGATAVCGPVGDCNSVQSSPYAKLFGFLPVGVLGALGYVGIFAAYFMQQRGPTAYRRFASLALWGMVWFGLLFSIYLTFLEPFVIGATCIWCVTSAVVMTLLFWASTPAALAALQPADDDPLLT